MSHAKKDVFDVNSQWRSQVDNKIEAKDSICQNGKIKRLENVSLPIYQHRVLSFSFPQGNLFSLTVSLTYVSYDWSNIKKLKALKTFFCANALRQSNVSETLFLQRTFVFTFVFMLRLLVQWILSSVPHFCINRRFLSGAFPTVWSFTINLCHIFSKLFRFYWLSTPCGVQRHKSRNWKIMLLFYCFCLFISTLFLYTESLLEQFQLEKVLEIRRTM